ncbi:hypothetical protein C0J52_24430 [Blattella germanica]|nr:hypothetical protein C0J52_24430 [Blattella germanica]
MKTVECQKKSKVTDKKQRDPTAASFSTDSACRQGRLLFYHPTCSEMHSFASNKAIKLNPFKDKLIWWCDLIMDFIIAIFRAIPILFMKFCEVFNERKCKDISGKVALVTGTAKGLGREIALELARYGCSVCCVDILANENKIVAAQIQNIGQKATAYTCDVTNRDQVMQLAEHVGPVDMLVNNAGIIFIDPLLQTPSDVVQKMIQAFLPGMLERNEGHIVSIASCGGLIGLAKGLMNSLSEELRVSSRQSIRLSCVCPYFVNTVDDIKTRVHARIPALETGEAARLIVKGIRQELNLFTVPGYLLNLIGLQRLSTGLGRALALEFAKAGCHVICVDVAEESNRDTARKIVSSGGHAVAYSCDVTDRSAVLQLASVVGRVDILVNNAGIIPFVSLLDATEEQLRKVMEVNTLSHFWVGILYTLLLV